MGEPAQVIVFRGYKDEVLLKADAPVNTRDALNKFGKGRIFNHRNIYWPPAVSPEMGPGEYRFFKKGVWRVSLCLGTLRAKDAGSTNVRAPLHRHIRDG